jgi:Na+/proline symporter
MSFNSRTELLVGRLGVIAVAVAALLLSLASADNVLTMVSHAWAGFGAAFGPLMIASLCWPKTTGTAAISSMLSGGTVVIAWIYGPFTIGGVATQDVIYAMVPGFLVSTIILVVVSKLTFNAAALSRANDSIDLLKQQIKTA